MSASLQSLPVEKLENIVQIIKKRNLSLCQQEDEIEVDIDSFDTEWRTDPNGDSCGRMVITDPNPAWRMEDMPGPRTMSDMLILPNEEILIIKGAQKGIAGWDRATTPSFSPLLYRPKAPLCARFFVLAPSSIARMYHSSASILPNDTVMVGGSNQSSGSSVFWKTRAFYSLGFLHVFSIVFAG